MARVEELVALGLFAVEDFLEPELCADLRAQARAAVQTPATVIRRGESVLDERVRRTRRVQLDPVAESLLHRRLSALIPPLEAHFGTTLTRPQQPQLLVYRKGDRFRPHQDTDGSPDEPELVRMRRISAVTFLNSEARRPSEGNYCGGSLAFYRLVDDPTPETVRMSLIGQAGLLIAFPADVFHEVSPVTHGERYTVVTWFE